MIRGRAIREMHLDSLREDFAALTSEAQTGAVHPDENVWALFATNELPADERERLVDHVIDCAECAAVYRAVIQVRRGSGAFDVGAPRLRMPAALSRWSYTGLALAASLLIAAGVTVVLRDGGPVDRSQSDRVGVPISPGVIPSPPREPRAWARGGEAPVVKLPASAMGLSVRSAERKTDEILRAFGEAIAPYRQRRYAEAAQALAPLAAQHPDMPEIAFYLGVSRLLAGDAAGALVPLRAAHDSTVLSNEARWYEAVTLERIGRPADADIILGRLCDSPGPYQETACAIVRSTSP